MNRHRSGQVVVGVQTGQIKRRGRFFAHLDVHIGAMLDQKNAQGVVSVNHGLVQGRSTKATECIRIGAGSKQQTRSRQGLSTATEPVKRDLAFVIDRIDPCPRSQQGSNAVNTPDDGRVVQREQARCILAIHIGAALDQCGAHFGPICRGRPMKGRSACAIGPVDRGDAHSILGHQVQERFIASPEFNELTQARGVARCG